MPNIAPISKNGQGARNEAQVAQCLWDKNSRGPKPTESEAQEAQSFFSSWLFHACNPLTPQIRRLTLNRLKKGSNFANILFSSILIYAENSLEKVFFDKVSMNVHKYVFIFDHWKNGNIIY